MSELLTQLQTFYSRLSTVQKGVLIGSIAAALAGFATLLLWSNEPEYRPLFTNLSQEDAAAIVNKLKDERVPYRILSGGSSIAVPVEQIYESHLRLASEGLPQGGKSASSCSTAPISI
jgi:flagellar M-ring protein FliF